MKGKRKVKERVLAWYLVLLMVVSIIPFNMFKMHARADVQSDGFTITVKNDSGELLEGVSIEYLLKKGTLTIAEKTKDTTLAGTVSIPEITDDLLNEAQTASEEVTVDITAKKKGYKEYSNAGISVTASIKNVDVQMTAKQADDTFAFEKTTAAIKYGDSFSNTASSRKRTDTVNYSVVSGDDCVSVDSDGVITTLKSGTAKIKAVLLEDDTWQESEAFYDLTVNKADDSNFVFAAPAPDAIIYSVDGTFSNTASGGSGTGSISYEILNGNDYASIDTGGTLHFIKAGTVTVKATKASDDKYNEISEEYTIEIKKASQNKLSFENEAPSDVTITDGTFSNAVSGGTGDGQITYEIVSGLDYASVDDVTSPVITLKKAGTITVKVTKAADDRYEEESATYNLTIKKAQQAALTFAAINPEITYAPDWTYTVSVAGGSGTGALSYYILDNGNNVTENDIASIDTVTGVVSKKGYKTGVVKIVAVKAADDSYEATSVTCDLTIKKAEQTGVQFDKNSDSVTYGDNNNEYANPATGGESTGKIVYSIESVDNTLSGVPCASLDQDTGKVTVKGSGQIKIKAVKQGDDCYEDSEAVYYTLIIAKAEQQNFKFADTVPASVTYNENNNEYVLAATGGNGNGAVTYKVVSGDAVEISGNKLTVKKSGTAVIRVDKAESDGYLAAFDEITITVAKAEQSIKFNDTATSQVVYGNVFSNEAVPVVNNSVPDGKGYVADTVITYEVVAGNNIANVDTNGKLTFKNGSIGTVTVKASKLGNSCYEDTECEYTIEVVYLATPQIPYTLSGEKKNDDGWYTGNVTITPATGYKISYSNDLTNNDWKDSIEVSDEGLNAKTIYLKNDSGITGAININENDIKIDKTKPENLSISYSKSVFDIFLQGITFGFYKAPVTVTLEAKDVTSGIKNFTYSYEVEKDASDINTGANDVVAAVGDEGVTINGGSAKAVFKIDEQFRGKVSFTATDNAGNVSDICKDNKMIVVDDIAPGVSVTFDNTDVRNGRYYKADRTAEIVIDEENFFVDSFNKLSDISVNPAEIIAEHLKITVTRENDNGITTTTNYTNEMLKESFTKGNDGKWRAKVAFTEDGDYTFTVGYSDFSGNAADTYRQEFTIDKTAPQVLLNFHSDTPVEGSYYDKERTADVIITEHNFNPSDIKVSCVAKDADNKDVDVKSYQEILEKKENWEKSGNTYTLKDVAFDVDAVYAINIEYADLAGNEQESECKADFTVDTTKPENLSISYSKSVLDTILEKIFKFYKAPVTVTLEAKDETSGIKNFTYSYEVEKDASKVNTGASDVVAAKGNEGVTINGSSAKAVFKIDAQFRGKVSFTATDNAGNVSDICKDNKMIVVDDIAPGVSVTFDNTDVRNGRYYKADRTAEIVIDEENFFVDSFNKLSDISVNPAEIIAEHLKITVTRENDNGITTTTNYTNEMLKESFTKGNDGKWRAKVAFTEDGDYTFTVGYSDFSGNAADTYRQEFTIDKTAPQVLLNFHSDTPVEGSYYDKERTADVIITEHNFNPSDIKVSCVAKDADNKDVDVKSYQEILEKKENWEKSGNTYTLKDVAFDVDAVYAINIEYADLAGNEQESECKADFTVDTTKPENLSISYSKSVLDTILEKIFKFYKAPVTVTLEAKDETSGIKNFTYSYEVEKDASKVNTGASDVVAAKGNEGVTINGSSAKAVFKIDAQFRGKVSFTATDNAGNVSDICKDNKTIVVDDIAPIVEITLDGPKKSDKYEQYYSDYPVTANIKINEANFFAEAFEKVEDISVNPSELVDEHLKITVTTELNNGTKTEKVYKNDDLTTKFTKGDADEWNSTIKFDTGEDAIYTIKVECTDFSGNKAETAEKTFIVDKTDPRINVDYSNNDVRNGKYFNADRKAKITITERNFNAADVELNVTADKAVGNIADYAAYLKNSDNWTNTGDTHTAEITFSTEAFYKFDISYTDMSGRKNESVNYGDSKAATDFVIDKTAPVNSDIKINDSSVLARGGVAFEKFYRNDVTVKFSTNADISGIKSVKYQKVNDLSSYNKNGTWNEYDSQNGVVVKPNEKFVIYFMVEDMAGNTVIVNSTGIVVDDKAPIGEKAAPEIDIIPDAANANGLHNGNVNVAMKVVDPKYSGVNSDINGYCSGINKITYRIYTRDTDAVETGTLMDISANNTNGAVFDKDNLISSWSGNITVDASRFNSNNVVVEVKAVDNAGNERVTTNEMIGQAIKIDITAPAIDVSYDNNTADNNTYFKENRTARIQITERNFNENDVDVRISNTDGVIPSVSGWTQYAGSGNMDNTTWVTYVTYDADGDYKFDISYKDMADNTAGAENYADGTVAAKEFTIDKTNPVIEVSYDNNDAENSNYYKTDRTATISVTEHNFQADRVIVNVTATDDGNAVTAPQISGWTSDGDINTATIYYGSDAYYTFNISMQDMAGNSSDEFAEQNFYVDKTVPELSISGVENNTANSGTVIPVISYSDTNYDESLVSITLTGANRKTVELDGSYAEQHNGRVFTFKDFANEKSIDDIYTLTASITDRAGNVSTQTVVFSVNRFGSTYELSSSTENLNGTYVKSTEDVVLSEVNVNQLTNIKLTLYKNDATIVLKENEDYRVSISGGNGQWYQYTYTVFAKNFSENGVYRITVQSDDATGRTQKTDQDTKNVEIQFGIDNEPPVINVKNLESKTTYAMESKEVEMTVRDNLKLGQVIVELDGNEYKTWSGDELEQIVQNGGNFTFNIDGNSTSAHNIVVYASDAAGNGAKTANADKPANVVNIDDFYVTTNKWVQYINNKPLFYGSIIAVIAVVGLGVFAVTFVRRKKDKAEK